MSERDELTQIIDDRWHGYGYNPQGAADAILAAGYRKREFSVDEATSERAARALFAIENPEADWEALPLNQWITDIYRKRARVVLAAAMGSEA